MPPQQRTTTSRKRKFSVAGVTAPTAGETSDEPTADQSDEPGADEETPQKPAEKPAEAPDEAPADTEAPEPVSEPEKGNQGAETAPTEADAEPPSDEGGKYEIIMPPKQSLPNFAKIAARHQKTHTLDPATLKRLQRRVERPLMEVVKSVKEMLERHESLMAEVQAARREGLPEAEVQLLADRFGYDIPGPDEDN